MALRLIQGGRASDGLPGLLIEHAAEVATLAGGLRTGARMDDAAVLTANADGALIVLSSGKTLDAHLAESLVNLRQVNGHVLGVVLNKRLMISGTV